MPFLVQLKDYAGNVMHRLEGYATKEEAHAVKDALVQVTQASFADVIEYAPQVDHVVDDVAKAADEVAPFVPVVAEAEPIIDEIKTVADEEEPKIVAAAESAEAALVQDGAATGFESPALPASTTPLESTVTTPRPNPPVLDKPVDLAPETSN